MSQNNSENYENFSNNFNSNPTEIITQKIDRQHDDYQKTTSHKLSDDFNRLVYPNQSDDFVPYGDTICKIKNQNNIIDPNINSSSESNIEKNEQNTNQIKSECQNKSLNELHKLGNTYYKNGSVCNQLMSTAQLTSSFPSGSYPFKIDGYNTRNETINEEPIDPVDFYKNIYKPRRLSLEDDRFKGWNYNNFENNGSLDDIGDIQLRKTNNYPVGVNFAFN